MICGRYVIIVENSYGNWQYKLQSLSTHNEVSHKVGLTAR